MYKELEIENYGKLTINKNEIIGTIEISLNGIKFTKYNKRLYKCNFNEEVIEAKIVGDSFSGLNLIVLNNEIRLTSALSWYRLMISCIALLFSLIFGNVPYFAKNGFYVLGGAFGGLIGGLVLGLGIYIDSHPSLSKGKKTLYVSLLAWLGIFMLIGIGYLIVNLKK